MLKKQAMTQSEKGNRVQISYLVWSTDKLTRFRTIVPFNILGYFNQYVLFHDL